jgi:hypothetical protein
VRGDCEWILNLVGDASSLSTSLSETLVRDFYSTVSRSRPHELYVEAESRLMIGSLSEASR